MNPMKLTFNPSHTRTMFVRLLVSGLVALLLGVLLALPALAAGSGTWTTTASMHASRTTATATLLPNGQVLVAGGCCDPLGGSLASAELYNPTTGAWTVTGSLNTSRYGAGAALLQNGQVLVAGGISYDDFGDGFTLTSAELYNPATGTWTTTGSMNNIHSDGYESMPPLTVLANGQVLVVGGCCNPATGVGNNPIGDLYNPATGTWTNISPTHVARDTRVAALLSTGQVLVAGGSDDLGHPITSAELYNPSTNTWSFTGSMPVDLNETVTVLQSGKVLVTGVDSSHSAELYDPTTGTWSLTGSLNTLRGFAQTVLLPNGEVLIAGGERSSTATASAELYNPATGTWITTGSMQHARWSHTMTLLQNGQVLAAEGQDSTPAFLSSAELYTP